MSNTRRTVAACSGSVAIVSSPCHWYPYGSGPPHQPPATALARLPDSILSVIV